MASLGQAYVQIIPEATGISGKIGKLITPGAKSAGEKAGKESGGGFAAGIKGVVAKLAIGGTIVAGLKAAISEGAKLQQSYGGLETIYGDAAGAAKEYAAQAAQAGISANDYAEQAVSFGASLKQAFEGDTTKAVEAANTAILDMADNAAKMGTPLESIQNAYQGFAKGNYTMLDNLKLGYGGTKEEMQRLLADAEKLTGVKYDMNNLGDVYDAIHAIQGDLGLTGVAAAEASQTFSGSFEAMKAAAANLAGNLALGEDIGPSMQTLLSSVGTFIFGNLLPMVGRIATSLPEALSTALSTAIPVITAKAPGIINGLITTITTNAPKMATSALTLIQSLVGGITANMPALLESARGMINNILSGITAALPGVLSTGMNVVISLATGILNNIPTLISSAGNMISDFINFLTANAPTIGKFGARFLQVMARNIITAIPKVLAALLQLIPKIGSALMKLLPAAQKASVQMIKGLVNGIKSGMKNITPAIKGVVEKIKKPIDELKEKLKTKMTEIMTSIVGVWNNIKTKAGEVWEGIKSAITGPIDTARSTLDGIVQKIRNFFPINFGKILHFQIPKISVSGGTPPWGIGGAGTKPSFHVDWSQHFVGGIAKGLTVHTVAEKGNEAIVPLTDPYMRPFAESIASQMGSTGNTFYITVSGSGNPTAVADEIIRRVNMKMRMA